MSNNIQFEGDQPQFRSRTVLGTAQVPGMAAWLLKKGIIKQESQAGGILLGIICVNLVLIALVLYFFVL